ncbi:putative glutathione S-transferase-like protein [Labilithrix luteola]|uniref:Putative glutathione S-transferase-like protein n=2 Tax=Labilithrix luteola TaxID=1391654 RepID=A0A0K1PK67_9BACT|nr:putative glutathione S-transferase-like protein [Labilithrix luteola]
MILYHFPTSAFARRVRLTLALKGLAAELRDARADDRHLQELRRLNPFHTVPVLVDGERVVCDSVAICDYLDRKAPAPPLWPEGVAGAEAFEIATATSNVVHILADLGVRYAPLHGDANYPAVREALVGRVQRGLDHLASLVEARAGASPYLVGGAWSGADIALYTTVAWLEGLGPRSATYPPAKRVVDLGWTLPPSLSTWAAPHRNRPDVRALD